MLLLNEDGSRKLTTFGNMTGEPSEEDGKFNRPLGIACNLDGSILVGDVENHRVQIFDARGIFVRKFGSCGKGKDPIHLRSIRHMCMLDSRLNSHSFSPLILIADKRRYRISIWSADGSQHIANIQVQSQPLGVCVDLNGFIHVSCWTTNTVQVYDPRNGYALMQKLGSTGDQPGQLHCPAGLCVDEFNTLIVAETHNRRLQFFRAWLCDENNQIRLTCMSYKIFIIPNSLTS